MRDAPAEEPCIEIATIINRQVVYGHLRSYEGKAHRTGFYRNSHACAWINSCFAGYKLQSATNTGTEQLQSHEEQSFHSFYSTNKQKGNG
jgi:hypothetical protein